MLSLKPINKLNITESAGVSFMPSILSFILLMTLSFSRIGFYIIFPVFLEILILVPSARYPIFTLHRFLKNVYYINQIYKFINT